MRALVAGGPGSDLPAARAGAVRPDSSADDGLLSRLRWDPGRRGALALGGLVVVVLAALGWWLAGSRPHEVPIAAGSAPASGSVPSGASTSPVSGMGAAPSGGGGSGAAASSASSLVVDVAGRARRPGIYRLPAGARVYDALRAAGGARPGVSTLSLNLAEPLRDGEQIVVGGPAPPASGGSAVSGGASGGASGTPAVVDLNTATLEQLETLPGVGPVLGQHILDWRDAHGRFNSVDQLQQVSGIGDVRFAQLKPLVAT